MVYDVIVSGHLCADLIPDTSHLPLRALSSPGKLYEIDKLEIATGGSVSNTGLALHKLGVNVGLMTAVGDDLLGQVIIAKLNEHDRKLGEMIAIRKNEASSYSIILSPENRDRIILHCTGNNEHFDAADIKFDVVRQSKIFHLGYPPLLPRLYADNAKTLVEIFEQVYRMGVITSLDMAHPDPKGKSGHVDWQVVLKRTLPYVDVFLPSIEEIVFMLRRSNYDNSQGDVLSYLSRDYLRALAQSVLDMGSTVVAFKMGELGFYLRTSKDKAKLGRLESLGLNVNSWCDLEMWQPAFVVDVVGTTGAGDSAYGGFLAALLHGLDAEMTLKIACAVGACSVEAHDASSAIRSWDETLARINAGWKTSPRALVG